jgi:hypothetical protein
MVSGWMHHEEDYKRSFGIMPTQLSLAERLARFYSMHSPERYAEVYSDDNLKWVMCIQYIVRRLSMAADEAGMFRKNPDLLYEHVSFRPPTCFAGVYRPLTYVFL